MEIVEEDEMSKELQSIDLKIAKKQALIQGLENYVREIDARISRHKNDLRNLGKLRSEKATFKLGI